MSADDVIQPWPRRPARLASAVIDTLVDRIVSGEFPQGAALPIEPMLAETFGVSRPVVREAIKALETMRLVQAKQGQGTRILPVNEWDLVNPIVLAAVVRHDSELAILDELVGVRRSLEAQMAREAATRLTPEDRALIEERMGDLDQKIDDPQGYAVADVAFHDAILAASGNRLGRAIINRLTEEAYRSLRYIGEPTQHDREISNIAHRAIRDAVFSGDPDLAAERMNAHILEAWERRRPPGNVPDPSKT